jgi:hypothetical protein
MIILLPSSTNGNKNEELTEVLIKVGLNLRRTITMKGNRKNTRKSEFMVWILPILVTFLPFSFTVQTQTCDAESEASSEAGLEAPVNLRRRRRRYNQQSRQNNLYRKQVLQQARQRARQSRLEQKQLSQGPQIKTYGSGLRRGKSSQEKQSNQNSISGQTSGNQ